MEVKIHFAVFLCGYRIIFLYGYPHIENKFRNNQDLF